MNKAVVLHSGGMDSSTLLWQLSQSGFHVYPLGVNYGQRHSRELKAAQAICAQLKVPYRSIDLTDLGNFLTSSVLTDHDQSVPQGLYDQSNMRQTIVPNRNMILLAIAAGYAQSLGAAYVFTAVHAGDHAVYPDCRPDFIAAAAETVRIATEGQVRLFAPYEATNKTDIASIGRDLNVPYELTWSCYAGGDVHCGVCGTCTERIEAFWNAQVEDRTQYAEDGLVTALKWLRDAGKLEGPGPRAYHHAYA